MRPCPGGSGALLLEGGEAGWRRCALCWGIGPVRRGQLQQQPPLTILILSKWASNSFPITMLPCTCEKNLPLLSSLMKNPAAELQP